MTSQDCRDWLQVFNHSPFHNSADSLTADSHRISYFGDSKPLIGPIPSSLDKLLRLLLHRSCIIPQLSCWFPTCLTTPLLWRWSCDSVITRRISIMHRTSPGDPPPLPVWLALLKTSEDFGLNGRTRSHYAIRIMYAKRDKRVTIKSSPVRTVYTWPRKIVSEKGWSKWIWTDGTLHRPLASSVLKKIMEMVVLKMGAPYV